MGPDGGASSIVHAAFAAGVVGGFTAIPPVASVMHLYDLYPHGQKSEGPQGHPTRFSYVLGNISQN